MDAKQRAKWERWRRLGKRKFILLATFPAVVVHLVLYPVMAVNLFHEPFTVGMLVRAAFSGLILGLILGLLSWNSNERAYQDSTSREASRTD